MINEQFYKDMLKSQQEQIAALTAMVASLTRGAPVAQPQPIPQTPQAAAVSNNRMKVRDLCYKFLNARKEILRPGTISSYRTHLLASDFAQPLLDMSVDELTHQVFQSAIDNARATRYVRDFVNTYKTMLKWARVRKVCDTPPIDPDAFEYKKSSFRNPHEEIDEQTSEKIKELSFRDFKASNAARAVYIGISCGLRIGEVCGLMWSDYDTEKKVLHISRTVSRAVCIDGGTTVNVGSTKTDAGNRMIPLPRTLAELFADQECKECYVCAGRIQEERRKKGVLNIHDFTEPRTLRQSIMRWCAKNELPRFHFHSLRHTFVSQKIRSGAPAKAVAKYVGHTDIKMTLGTYTHVNQNDLEKVSAL